MRKLMDVVANEESGIPLIDEIAITEDGSTFQRIDEGKFVSGRFDRNIRIDQPTHVVGDGKVHAHVLGRKGNQIIVVNIDGTGSHGSKRILHPKDAEALRDRGFAISDDRIVEWTVLPGLPGVGLELLFG